jgi:transposase
MGTRGRPLQIEWQESAEGLFRRYRQETEPELRIRWHGLWLVRKGNSEREAAGLVGVDERTMRLWVAWYRRGGLTEVARHRRGGRQGRRSHLTQEQLAALKARVTEGTFRTIGEAVAWVEQNCGQRYTYWGMRSMFRRLRFKKKVPRPLGEKASLEAQEAWKKGGWQAG